MVSPFKNLASQTTFLNSFKATDLIQSIPFPSLRDLLRGCNVQFRASSPNNSPVLRTGNMELQLPL